MKGLKQKVKASSFRSEADSAYTKLPRLKSEGDSCQRHIKYKMFGRFMPKKMKKENIRPRTEISLFITNTKIPVHSRFKQKENIPQTLLKQ